MSSTFTSIDHFFRGAFSVDIVIFTYNKGEILFLLEKKKEHPYTGSYGLPGKLILPNENTDQAINCLCLETIGLNNFYIKQLNAFSDIDRHPLGRVISFSYYGLIPFADLNEIENDSIKWISINKIPKLAYDHNKIINHVIKRFKKGLLRHPNVFELLPETFTLSELIEIYEIAFERKIDHSNFGKQVKASDLIESTDKKRDNSNKAGRPAQLYFFNKAKYNKNKKDKIQFNF
jgi:8-oxo-dGTP diphosphatase